MFNETHKGTGKEKIRSLHKGYMNIPFLGFFFTVYILGMEAGVNLIFVTHAVGVK